MKSLQIKFPRRVRILGGECGAVARALHHEAEKFSLPAVLKKVSSTTIERKVMSKKTFFKRIALTAIAALSFGMLSVAPSQAAVTSHTLTIDADADSTTVNDSATAVLTHSFVNLGSAFDSVVITAIVTSSNASTAGTLSLTVSDSYTSTANDATRANSPNYNGGGQKIDTAVGTNYAQFASTAPWNITRDSITIAPIRLDANDGVTRAQGTSLTLRMYNVLAAGTYVVDVFTQVSNAGAALTSSTVAAKWTVTVTEPSRTATAASTATVRNARKTVADGTSALDDSTTLYSAYAALATDTVPEATIHVLQSSGTSTNTARESFTVNIAGEACVTAANASLRPTAGTCEKSKTFAYSTAGTSVPVEIWSTRTAGTATVNITTASGVALGGTKTFTFSGMPTKIEVVKQYKKYVEASAAASVTSVAAVKVTDSGGRAVYTSTPSVVSSALDVISTGSCTDTTKDASTRDGTFLCDLTPTNGSESGDKATITARVVDPSVTTSTAYLTTTFDVTLGGAIEKIVLTTDKSSYEPGEYMVITATAKDDAGNTPYDGQSLPSTLVANKSLGASVTMNALYDGVSTSQTRDALDPRVYTNSKNLFAPAASGKFTIQGTDGQLVAQVVSVTATVGDDAATSAANAASDAAAEAIDAANAATDAANLAAEAADAATVAAEEARDAADAATAAVEELATQVATLMAALKAQITTLANTVAKIAKKVKA